MLACLLASGQSTSLAVLRFFTYTQLPCAYFTFKGINLRSLGEDTHSLSNMLAAHFRMARRLFYSIGKGHVETHHPIAHPGFSYMHLRQCRSSPYHHQASLKSKKSSGIIGILTRAASVGVDGKFSFYLKMKLALRITPGLMQGCMKENVLKSV